MKKILVAIFVALCLICASVMPVLADSGQSNLNIAFIVIVCLLTPVLIGVIVYYSMLAKKQKKCDNNEKSEKIVRDYDDK